MPPVQGQGQGSGESHLLRAWCRYGRHTQFGVALFYGEHFWRLYGRVCGR